MRPGRAGNFDDAIVVLGADGTMTLVAVNRQNGPQELAIKQAKGTIAVTRPAKSVHAVRVGQATGKAALRT